jgi:hypothetical protein
LVNGHCAASCATAPQIVTSVSSASLDLGVLPGGVVEGAQERAGAGEGLDAVRLGHSLVAGRRWSAA